MFKRISLILLFIYYSLLALPIDDNVLYLDGDGDYLNLPQAVINSTAFTVEGYAYMHGAGGGLWSQNPFFQQRSPYLGDVDRSTLIFVTENQHGEIGMGLASIGYSYQDYQYNPRADYGEWHHYAYVITGENVYIYLDGVKILEDVCNQHGDYTSDIYLTDIGRHTMVDTDYGYFNGMLNEMRIWNKELSQSEIQELNLGQIDLDSFNPSENGLVAYWRFDEIQYKGTENGILRTIEDLSGNGNTGTLIDDAVIVDNTESISENKIKVESVIYNENDVAFIPINVDFSEISGFNTITFSIEKSDKLELLQVIPNSQLVSIPNTEISFETVDNSTVINVQSTEPILSEGLLVWLKMSVLDNSSDFINVNLDAAEVGGLGSSPLMISGAVVKAAEPKSGDVFHDGLVDVNDCKAILEHITGIQEIDHDLYDIADVNQDGSITSLDASIILQYINGTIDELPAPYSLNSFPAFGEIGLGDPIQGTGQLVSIPIVMNDGDNIFSLSCEISFNSESYTFNGFNMIYNIEQLYSRAHYGCLKWSFALAEPLSGNAILGYMQFTKNNTDAGSAIIASDICLNEINSTVPVEMSSFTAHNEDGCVLLQWTTKTETNNLGFHIYRSSTLDGPWMKVNPSIIPGNCTSSAENKYSFIDTDIQNFSKIYYKIEQLDTDGSVATFGPVELEEVDGAVPNRFALKQNYPNPFNSNTRIEYSVPRVGYVNISIFNTRGQLVRELLNANQSAGNHDLVWQGTDQFGNVISSGVYLVRMTAGNYNNTLKMLYVK